MANTNFANMGLEERLAWGNSLWEVARVRMFVSRFMGTSSNSVIQRITSLKKVKGASRAVIQLVADLQEDGVGGDENELEGKEEALRAFEQIIDYDMLRHAVRNTGRLSDMKSTIAFRNSAKDKLGFFFGDRIDQMAFLMLSGISFEFLNNGGARPGGATGTLPKLVFHKITAPTSNRHLRVKGKDIAAGATASMTTADVINYRSLVRAKAFLKDTGLRGLRIGYNDMLHVFVTATGMADLRLDEDFMNAVKECAARGDSNQFFKGASSVMVDGMMVHEYKYVYNTTGAAAGSKWGAAGDVNGMRVLICGAQALGFFDHGAPQWNEKGFDYDNQTGIATGKIFGMLKPVFHNDWTKQNEDYGVAVLDCALSVRPA